MNYLEQIYFNKGIIELYMSTRNESNYKDNNQKIYNLLQENITENKFHSIKRINRIVAINEKQILNGIIGAVIVIIIIEIVIALYLVAFQYSQIIF